MKRILIVINKPDLSKGVANTQYCKLIKSLPVEVETGAFPYEDVFVIEFASRSETDLNKAVRYFLNNWDSEVIDIFKLGNKKVASI